MREHDGRTATTTRTTGTPPPRLWLALSLLAVACFCAVLTENLPAGMLPQISRDLGVGEPTTGSLVSVFAVASALGAVPGVVVLRGLHRRQLLLGLLGGFVLANAATALAPSYLVCVVARVVGGVVAGVLWSMVVGYAARLSPPGVLGRAVAIVLAGSTIALALGLPVGALVGTALSWRWAFGGLAVLGVVLAVAVRVAVPDAAGDPDGSGRTPALALIARPGMAAVAAASLFVGGGHNALYTYVAPFLARSDPPGGVTGILLVFGVASVLGNAIAGRFLDARPRGFTLATVGGLTVVLLGCAAAPTSTPVVLVAVLGWGVVFGGLPAAFQSAALRVSRESSEVAVAVAVTVYNVGIALGSAGAGAAFDALGIGAVPWVAVVLTVGALGVVVAARRHAFPAAR